MALFAIGDLHLSLNDDKPMDIFHGWEDYVARLENNWRSVVTDTDTVVIPGDVSWAMSLEDTQKDFAFLHSLPGKKLLLKGNHDYWWTTRRKMDNYLAESGFDDIRIVHNDTCVVDDRFAVCGTRGWFYDAEQDADRKILAREVGRLQMSVKAAKATGFEPICFLHYPPVFGDMVCREMLDALHELGITRLYYGHIHSNGIRRAVSGEYEGIVMQLISGDAVSFMPQLIR